MLKNGKVYDTRHSSRKWFVDSPVIWVFTNSEPDTELLSSDRWRLWTINEKKELRPYIKTTVMGNMTIQQIKHSKSFNKILQDLI